MCGNFQLARHQDSVSLLVQPTELNTRDTWKVRRGSTRFWLRFGAKYLARGRKPPSLDDGRRATDSPRSCYSDGAHFSSSRDCRAHAPRAWAARMRRRGKRRKRAIRVPAVSTDGRFSQKIMPSVCRAIHLSSVSGIYLLRRTSCARIRNNIKINLETCADRQWRTIGNVW